MYDVTLRSETEDISSTDHRGEVVGGDSGRYRGGMEAMHKSALTADGVQRRSAGKTLQRVVGVARLGVHNPGGASRIKELYQEGAFRLRLPRPALDEPPEVITINTAGGLTGGDRLDLAVNVERNAEAVVTSQACERIYRSSGGRAHIGGQIKLGPASRLAWLAQPMIVFDRSDVRRTLSVDMADDARLLAVDGLILGRTAMGEDTTSGSIHDGWRIRRGGKLVVADAFRAGPDIAPLRAKPAALGARRAIATIVYCAPDAERRLGEARGIISALTGDAAASAWNGCLLIRVLSDSGQTLVADLIRFLSEFRNRPVPRTWTC